MKESDKLNESRIHPLQFINAFPTIDLKKITAPFLPKQDFLGDKEYLICISYLSAHKIV